jgi:predicted HicB family RNase H-like nuclease
MPNGDGLTVIFVHCDPDLKIAIKVDAARRRQSLKEWVEAAARDALDRSGAAKTQTGD